MSRGTRRSWWGQFFAEMDWLEARTQQILAAWRKREEEDPRASDCCIAIALWRHEHYSRAWQQALRELEWKTRRKRRAYQLTLF